MTHENNGPGSPESDRFRRRLEATKRAERALLGGLLRWPAAILEVLDIAHPEDLYDIAHQHIAATMLALAGQGKPVDMVTIGDYLHRKGVIAREGKDVSYALLGELWDESPTGAHVHHHAGLVREYALLRRLEGFCHETLSLVADPPDSAERLLAETEQRLFALSRLGSQGETIILPDAIAHAGDRIEARARATEPLGLLTGLSDLDELLAGFHPGELTVIAARPGCGKTAISLGIMKHVVCVQKRGVLFASQEQPHEELGERLLCGEARVSHYQARRGSFLAEEWDRLAEARNYLRQFPNGHFDDRPRNASRIVATARRLARRDGLALVIVDYVQLLEPDDRRAPRHEQIGAISRRLKLLAKEIPCSVILLSQLNRDAEDRQRPKLRDLKGSGDLEQDADQVILLHREPGPAGEKTKVSALVEKNRHGPTGEAALTFHGPYLTFGNYEMPPDVFEGRV